MSWYEVLIDIIVGCIIFLPTLLWLTFIHFILQYEWTNEWIQFILLPSIFFQLIWIALLIKMLSAKESNFNIEEIEQYSFYFRLP